MPVSKGHSAFDDWKPRALTAESLCTIVGKRHLILSSNFAKVSSLILFLYFLSNSWKEVNIPECNCLGALTQVI